MRVELVTKEDLEVFRATLLADIMRLLKAPEPV